MNLNIVPSIVELSNSLINALKTDDSQLIDKALHDLTMSTLNFQQLETANSNFISPVYRFIIYSSISLSGQILDPGRINGILTDLKWPFRASTFWEFVCRLEQSDIEDPVLWVSKFFIDYMKPNRPFFQDYRRCPQGCSRRYLSAFFSNYGNDSFSNHSRCEHPSYASHCME